MAGVKIKNTAFFSDAFIEAFNSRIYEKNILEIMNKSKKVFPGNYLYVDNQSHGECDFIEESSGKKFDAKLPFETKQIKILTNGKKHAPMLETWVRDLHNEASEYENVVNNSSFQISESRLCKIIIDILLKDKADESIILFFPFPIVLSIKGTIFLQFATDYLKAIYDYISTIIDLSEREIYAVYPSAEKSVFAVRNLKNYIIEYIKCTAFDKFFTYEINGISSNN